jgi:hypothetical protein
MLFDMMIIIISQLLVGDFLFVYILSCFFDRQFKPVHIDPILPTVLGLAVEPPASRESERVLDLRR